MVVYMKLNFIINKYLLMWYLLCRESNINEVNNFKQNFLSLHRKEAFMLIKEKDIIMSYLKDYIPDDDFIFNKFYNTDEFKKLQKDTNKYRISMLESYDKNKKALLKNLNKLLKYDLNISYDICFVHKKLDVIEFNLKTNLIILGKDIKSSEALGFYILIVYKILENEYKKFKPEEKEIVTSILELVIYNELFTRVSGKNRYNIGNQNLRKTKEKIYPYFLMYMGILESDFDKRMEEDNIYFDSVKYDNNLKLMDLYSFITFIIKNKTRVLDKKILKIKKEQEEML